MSRSRYREGAPDYVHGLHAGNLGDVLKHCLLGAWVRALQAAGPVRLVDTHAGAGMYALPPSGEWDAGIGRLDALDAEAAPPLVRAYLAAVGDRRRPHQGGLYPGSPAQVRSLLRPDDRLTLVELADAPRAKLGDFYAGDAQVEVRGGDGLAAAVELAAGPGRLAVFIDPAYTRKAEWIEVAEAVLAIRAANPAAAVFVWYPIKSLMRPHALAAAVRGAGPGLTVDLITTPLNQQRKALNGSGVLLVDPPAGWVEPVLAALPWLGAVLAHPSADEWTTTVRGYGAQSPESLQR